MINCSGSKVNVSVGEVGGGGGPTVSPSVTAVMTWACRALIDFETVLELDETVSSLR